MVKAYKYDLLIIGGGISACVFASKYLEDNPRKKIALVEIGRGLGGRSSTRISRRFKGWEHNHGSPNLNIRNKSNNKLLKKYIDELLEKKFIRIDDSDIVQLSNESNFGTINCSEFTYGNNYLSSLSMSNLAKNIISTNNFKSQIDFYFETFILNLKFIDFEWELTSINGDKFNSKYIVCTSNLLLHKRSLEIINTNYIPIRNAIPENRDKNIDSLLMALEKQSFISRLTFLIYTKENYTYKDSYCKKNRYFYLNKFLEKKYKIERIIFQRQNNKLGVVVHSKSSEIIDSYSKENNKDLFKQKILKCFNDLFLGHDFINQLSGDENISIMQWRASQPVGEKIPLSLQLCKNYKIGFCGDWFEGEGFGRIEGAILSALILANKFKTIN